MTAKPTARVIAEQLFSGPDPICYAKRAAVSRLVEAEQAMKMATKARRTAAAALFVDLQRMHIGPTALEAILAGMVRELRKASTLGSDALELLASARLEAEIRFLDDRARERREREGAA